MPASFRHAALIGKYDATGMLELLHAIADFVTRRGLEVSVEGETARQTGLQGRPIVEPEDIGHRCDLAIVVGGDGTMLRFSRLLAPHGTPPLGINRGRVGFITDAAVEVVWDALASIIAGDYVWDRRPLLVGRVWPLERGDHVCVRRGAFSA
jgi:NAD+ kinase